MNRKEDASNVSTDVYYNVASFLSCSKSTCTPKLGITII